MPRPWMVEWGKVFEPGATLLGRRSLSACDLPRNEMRSGKKNILKWSTIGLGVLLLVFAVLALVPQHSPAARRKIEQHLQGLKERGVPVSGDDLVRAYPDPSPHRDAEVLLTNCFKLLVKPQPGARIPFLGGGNLPAGTETMPPDMHSDVREFIAANRAALEALPKQWPEEARFPYGWSGGFTNVKTLPLVKLRQLMQLLTVQACFAAEEGRTQEAVEAIENGLKLANAIPPDFLVSYMIGRAGQGLTVHAVERLLNLRSLSEAQLNAIEKELRPNQAPAMGKAFIAERCQAIWAFDSLIRSENLERLFSKEDLSLKNRVRRLVRLDPPLMTQQDVLGYLELMEKLIPVFAKDPAERLTFLHQNKISQKLDARAHSQFARMVYPNYEKALEKDVRITTQLNVVQTALAVERFRAAHQTLPAVLTELTPKFLSAIPVDPYSKQPLGFKRLGVGYVIYSVRPNGDGEAAAEDATSQDNLLIRIER